MEHFGHWFDAFARLREIAESGSQSGELKAWAEAVAELNGERENFTEAWEDYRRYYTVDVPHRTVELRESTEHPASSYGQPVLVDKDGAAYDHWMVRPL